MSLHKRLISITLMVLMILAMMPLSITSVYAADEPAAIQDKFEIDGVTYYKVESDAFASSPTQYQLDMLRTKTSSFKFPNEYGDYFQYYWPCVGDFWLYIGAGLFREYDPGDATYFARATALEKAITGRQVNETISGKTVEASRVLRSLDLDDYEGAIQNYYSPEGAEREVYSQIFGNASLQSDKGYFKGDSDSKTVLAGAAYAETVGENRSKVGLAVYFSDFKVISLLPEYKDNNYIQKKTKTVTESDDIIASNVKNLTGTRITASQSISRSQTDTASSTVNGSKSHSHSKSLEVGFEQSFSSIGFKFHGKVGLSATDVVSSGWSKSESQSVTESTNQSVSVNLEPYTNIMLKQQSTTEEWLTVYNCPVALQYTATIVLYDHDGSVLRSCEFGSDAREDLYNRAVRNKNLNDKDGIRWSFFDSRPLTLTAIEKASSIVPMSSTGGSFTETVDTMESEVYGVLPIYPLYKVKVRAPNVSYISDETYSYGSYNYLNTDMYVGDFSYTNYMSLDAFNKLNVEYYGFSKDFGHWIVADAEGNEWNGDDAPVVLEKDPVSKNTMYKAVKPGVCYIKFVIDEDVYNTADHPDVFTKNSDLYQTAAVRINVIDKPFEGSISVGGSYTGYVYDEPMQLDADGKLTADICDKTGKEIVKPYVWEQKELSSKGITVDGNMVTFTKAGTFHVRAVSGDLVSDWIEIKAVDPTEAHKAEIEAEKAENAAEKAQAAADQAMAEAEELQKKADEAKEKLDNTYLSEIRRELSAAEQAVIDTQAVLDDKTAAEAEAAAVLETANAALAAAQAEYDAATGSEDAAEEELAVLQANLDAASSEAASAQESYDIALTELDTAQRANNRAKVTVANYQNNLNDPSSWMVEEEESAKAAYEAAQSAADAAKAAAVEAQSAADTAKSAAAAKRAEADASKAAEQAVTRKANPLTVMAKTATVKYSAIKKKAQTLAVTKVIKFTKDAKDKKNYTLSSAKKGSKSFKKYFTINKTTGKVTIKKGLKKGTYKIKVRVKALGNSNYKASTVKIVTFTIKVK